MLKYLLVFVPFIATAQTQTATSAISPDQAASIYQQLLTIASGTPGIIGALIAGIGMLVYGIIVVSSAISNIAAYFTAKKVRDEDSYQAYQAEQVKTRANNQRRELEAYDARKTALDQAKQIKLDKIMVLIKSDKLKDALLMVPDTLKDGAATIIYDSNITPEGRAMAVMKLIG